MKPMVIIEIDTYRSEWIEWSEVKARIAARTGDDRDDLKKGKIVRQN